MGQDQSRETVPALSKRKVDYAKLPVYRNCSLEQAAAGSGASMEEIDEEPPLKKAAALDDVQVAVGRSLLASLPAPKATLGLGSDSAGGGVRLDLSSISRPQNSGCPPRKEVSPAE